MSDKLIKPQASVPAYLAKQGDSTGAGCLDNEEGIISPPRLKLCQPGTPEVGENKAKIGDFYSQAHEASLGDEILVIPVRWSVEWIEFYGDDDEETGVKWRSTDPNSREVLAKGEDAWSFKQLNLLCVAPLNNDKLAPKPIFLTFAGTSFKAGKKMYTEGTRAVDCDIQAQIWKIDGHTQKDGKKNSKYRVANARFAGYAPQDGFEAAMVVLREFADAEIAPAYDAAPEGAASTETEEELPF